MSDTAAFDLVLRDGTCVLPWGEYRTDIGVRDGRIATLGVAAGAPAAEELDLSGLHVLPGLIDAHVHLRDPGNPAIESIATGTR
ncbi:MAG: dihydroorotase, partial [Gluconacetobacter diazotrophicus]|nr:dihydroorotase [Gluconacetobacter diazotrophicus]